MKKLLSVIIILTFAAPSFALTGISFGIKGGMVTNFEHPGFSVSGEGGESMPLGGLQAKISTIPFVDVIVTGEYAWKNETYNVFGYGFEVNRRDLLFSASAVYPVKFQVVSPYMGGGVATHSLGYDFTEPEGWALSTYDVVVPEDITRFGYHLMGGADIQIPAFPLTLNAEVRMNWIDTPGGAAKYNSFTAGLLFTLP